MDVRDTPLERLGYVQLTALNVATGFTAAQIPKRARMVLLDAEGQDIRWRDDADLPGGADPTAAIGMVLAQAGAPFMYVGKVAKLRFIEVAVSAKLNASFYA